MRVLSVVCECVQQGGLEVTELVSNVGMVRRLPADLS